MEKSTKSKIKKVLLYILTLFFFVIMFLFFSWWGLVGYIIFICLIAAYILYKRWADYLAVCDYGAGELEKIFGVKKNGKRKSNTKRKPSTTTDARD